MILYIYLSKLRVENLFWDSLFSFSLFYNFYFDGALEGFFATCDTGGGSPSGPFYPPGREAQPHIPEPEVALIPHGIPTYSLVEEKNRSIGGVINRGWVVALRLRSVWLGRVLALMLIQRSI